MSMFSWDENADEGDEDFLGAKDMEGHNREVTHCILNDPDCEACQ